LNEDENSTTVFVDENHTKPNDFTLLKQKYSLHARQNASEIAAQGKMCHIYFYCCKWKSCNSTFVVPISSFPYHSTLL